MFTCTHCNEYSKFGADRRGLTLHERGAHGINRPSSPAVGSSFQANERSYSLRTTYRPTNGVGTSRNGQGRLTSTPNIAETSNRRTNFEFDSSTHLKTHMSNSSLHRQHSFQQKSSFIRRRTANGLLTSLPLTTHKYYEKTF
jgi:hypothetical protein